MEVSNLQGLENVFEGIAKAAELSNRVEEGDYLGDDGLLYCRNCRTPKQCRVQNPFFADRIDTRFCLCKCKAEQAEQERVERQRYELEFEYDKAKYRSTSKSDLLDWLNRQRYKISPRLINERLSLMRDICFGEDVHLKDWTFENADGSNETIMDAARKYVDNFQDLKEQGKGLLLFGDVGVGKSYAAASIANALIDKSVPVYMTNFARIANIVQGLFDGKQDYYDSLNRFPLLILDDLAAERKTEYMQEIVFQVIDARSRAGLPIIVTTNLTSGEIKNPSEMAYKRTFSRLLGMCHPIEVNGVDKRKSKLVAEFQNMKDLLGV